MSGARSLGRAPVQLLLLSLAGCGTPSSSNPDASAPEPRVLYCATAHACNILGADHFSVCVSSREGPPASVQDCIAAAGADCAAARACTYDATHTSVCTFGEAPRCDGNIALTCDGATTTTSQTDCSLTANTCVAGTTSARCARGTCDAGATDHFCAGDVAAYCARPFLLGPDCAPLGATCVQSDAGVGCRGLGAPCIVTQCDGDALAPCLDGRRGHITCAAGQRCFPPMHGVTLAACGIAAECDPPTQYDRCLDGKLTYCRLGRIETLDCRALGFAGCADSPASGCVATLVEDGGSKPLIDMPLP